MLLQPLISVTVFLEGTLAGVFVGSAMMEHAARNLDAPAWISYNRAKDAVYGPVMPVFFGVTLLASIATAILIGAIPLILAAIALFVAGIITARIHLPLNKVFDAWSAADYAKDWSTLRMQWRRWNHVRVVCAIAAFALAILAF